MFIHVLLSRLLVSNSISKAHSNTVHVALWRSHCPNKSIPAIVSISCMSRPALRWQIVPDVRSRCTACRQSCCSSDWWEECDCTSVSRAQSWGRASATNTADVIQVAGSVACRQRMVNQCGAIIRAFKVKKGKNMTGKWSRFTELTNARD